jgi:sugar/nucleoside kinase (ribokinase family)
MKSRADKQKIDYLIVGHVTRDLTEEGPRLGGTAAYCSILASRMGLEVGVVTSTDEDTNLDPLSGIHIHNIPAAKTTTFKNLYTPGGRKQYLLERADPLEINMIPEAWRSAKIIHLAPVAGEIDLDAGRLFPEAAVCLTLQGWLRNWDEDGLVYPIKFPDPGPHFEDNIAAFVSDEDLAYDSSQIKRLRNYFPVFGLTKGDAGVDVFVQSNFVSIPTTSVEEIDPTGAGDIFAAAFMIYYYLRKKILFDSACQSTALASLSVTRPGVEGIPTREEIQGIEEVF